MTSNAFVLAVVWTGFIAHLVVGVLVARHLISAAFIPRVNLLVALLVLAYWAQRWYAYIFRGIKWYATDQLVPAYALAVCVVALLALWGRHPAVVLNWTCFVVNGLVLLGACLLFSFMRLDRLI